MGQADDDAIIDAFFVSSRRDRWRALLGIPSSRERMLDRLNHCKDFDERYVRLLQSGDDVVSILRARGAPNSCYVLSDHADIDGQTLPLVDAIRAAEQGGWGTILSCIAGKLAYYYDEGGERRLLLERPPHAEPW